MARSNEASGKSVEERADCGRDAIHSLLDSTGLRLHDAGVPCTRGTERGRAAGGVRCIPPRMPALVGASRKWKRPGSHAARRRGGASGRPQSGTAARRVATRCTLLDGRKPPLRDMRSTAGEHFRASRAVRTTALARVNGSSGTAPTHKPRHASRQEIGRASPGSTNAYAGQRQSSVPRRLPRPLRRRRAARSAPQVGRAPNAASRAASARSRCRPPRPRSAKVRRSGPPPGSPSSAARAKAIAPSMIGNRVPRSVEAPPISPAKEPGRRIGRAVASLPIQRRRA